MAGKNLRFGLMAGACCAALGILVPTASAQTGAPVGGEAGSQFELAFWQAVSASNDPALYEAYLKQYPAGTFAAIAHIKAESLRKPAAATVAPVPVPGLAPAPASGGSVLALPVPLFGAGLAAATPEAASALRDAEAAQRTAQDAQAAAGAAGTPSGLSANPSPITADSPVVTALVAPQDPIATPVFASESTPLTADGMPASGPALADAAATSGPVLADAVPTSGPVPSGAGADIFGNTNGMPVGSPALLASLSGDAAPAGPALASAAPSAGASIYGPTVPAIALPAPTAPSAMLAALGAVTSALPTVSALGAAVASQSTPVSAPVQVARAEPLPAPVLPAPVQIARAEPVLTVPSTAAVSVTPEPSYAPAQPQPYYTAPQPTYAAAPVQPYYTAPARPQYAAAAVVPRSRSRRDASTARFARAVVSTAAVSVEMPDATSQISPLGIMLGQIVRTQETPGAQYGLQEELTMPMRPRLMAMPEVAVPESFCSTEQRSAFNEGIYQPALAIASHNTEVASAYVRKLRTLYDNYQLSGDSTALASVAAEARDFARAANAANSIHDSLVNQFEDIMTTPFRPCGAIQ